MRAWPWTPVGTSPDQNVEVRNKPDELAETAIDLSPALSDGLGMAIITVEPEGGRTKCSGRQRRPQASRSTSFTLEWNCDWART